MRLLIIEDEKRIALPLKKAFERHLFSVDCAFDGKEGYLQAKINSYDCIVLDLNLPNMNGLEVASMLRKEKIYTPILMLTARSEQEDLIEGFQKGADDYLRKPFHFKELLLRIQALIKRNSLNKSVELAVKNITLNTTLKKVYKNKKEIICNAKEYGIMEYLLRNTNRVVSQEELLEHVWDSNIDSFTQTVRTNIKTLRQKIDPNKKIIITIKGSGYKIEN